jgi:hypothetical protein
MQMGENVPYTSYLSQKEHTFIKKKKFFRRFKAFEKVFFCVQGVKNAPFEKILARTL